VIATETREERGDAIGEGVVVEVGDGEESFGGLSDPRGEDREFKAFAQPHGREVDGGQDQGDHIAQSLVV
jgi:hypothetical protein